MSAVISRAHSLKYHQIIIKGATSMLSTRLTPYSCKSDLAHTFLTTPITPPTNSIINTRFRSLTTPHSSTLVYTGPLAKTVQLLKLVSVTTAMLTISFSPILVFLGNTNTLLAGRIGLSTLVMTVGVSTTMILHWFMKSYVAKLYYDQVTNNVCVETFNIIGRTSLTQFHISEARPPDRVSAFSTFQGGGRSFFLHTDIFEDVNLLNLLLGSFSVFEENKTDC